MKAHISLVLTTLSYHLPDQTVGLRYQSAPIAFIFGCYMYLNCQPMEPIFFASRLFAPSSNVLGT